MFLGMLDILFPPQCAACTRVGSGLCETCVPPADLPLVRTLPSLRVYGLGEYRGALRSAVLAVKDGRRDVARTLGERLGALVDSSMLLVPVRTTTRRRRVRGIDGVEYMARVAARVRGAGIACAIEPLKNDAQRGRSREQRLAARERFWCDPGLVAGRTVTLVDDVCTTGTTLEDCAEALRGAGASVAQALVAAVAND
jgi:predicted amidophosphoribosyltransferase